MLALALILTLAATIGGVKLLARRIAWSDERAVYGDVPAVPDEAKRTGRLNPLPSGGMASERIAVQSCTHTQSDPSQLTARGAL